MRTQFVSIVLVLAASTACKKGDDKAAGADPAPGAKQAEAPSAPSAPLAWKKIASMGIEVQVPGDADVQDGTAKAGFPSSTMYFTDGTPTLFIFGAKDLSESMVLSKDFDTSKARIQKEMNGFKAFTKEDKTADGFVLHYTGESMMDKNEALYGVTIRSTAAGLTLECQTNAKSEAEIAKAVKICKTIRAAR